MITSNNTIGKIFAIFSTDYRTLWTKSMDEYMWPSVINRWQDGLKTFPEDVVLAAASSVFKYFPTHPPTLGQFYNLCKRFKKDKDGVKIQKITYASISDDEKPEWASKEVVTKCLKEMREKIASIK